MITVKLPDGSDYTIKELLGSGDSNVKLSKSENSGLGFMTYGLSLAAGDTSGYEVCASRSAGCSKACLYTAGMGQIHSVQRARIAKTIAFFEQRNDFLSMLNTELVSAQKRAIKNKKRLAVRLNVLSDIMWEKIQPSLFTEFSDIQFYDYTKHYKRMLGYCKGKLPSNYHLTFSRSECNEHFAQNVLWANGNVAVVFDNKDIPKVWNGFKVVNGDETDLRFLDQPGTVVGLYAKGKARKDTSGFVVPSRIPLVTV
jgi:hypothetical protein